MQQHVDDEPTQAGGAAPEQRRCQYIKADGHGCRDWAVRGQQLCYRHGVFVHSGRGIDVPLLEDESSIVLVLSETLRAVALGTVPVKTGALLLDGCRLAHTMQMEKQKAANLERSRRRSEAREEQMAEQEISQQEISQQEMGEEEISQQEISQEEMGEEERSQESSVLGARCPVPCDEFDPRYEEIREGVLAAQAEPLDDPMEEELAVGMR